MTAVALSIALAPVALFVYAYVLYPLALAAFGRRRQQVGEPAEWPHISIVVVAHNAATVLGRTLEHLIAADYPSDRRQILVISDASTDGTDDIARSFAGRGVELFRVDSRGGKTAAENAAAHLVRGEITVHTDATLIVASDSIKALVRHFADPSVGVVSGRGVSLAATNGDGLKTLGEARYLDYETAVRALEARFGRIAGATGQLYAQRRELFQVRIAPTFVTRDFASTLIAHERGFRSLQENAARCYVARNSSLRKEYERKARTILLGLDTLFEYRRLLDPTRHGVFAFMLLSHKVSRWMVYLLAPLALVALGVLAMTSLAAYVAFTTAMLLLVAGLLGIYWPRTVPLPGVFAVCAYAVASAAAGLAGWLRFFRGAHATIWRPTERAQGIRQAVLEG